jgi:DNA polymerase III alpha subunit
MEICYAVGMDDAGVDDVYQAIKKAKGAGRGAKELFAAVAPAFHKAAKKIAKRAESVREALWLDVQAFQGYGFNKGHASSYGVLATKMAWLKCHHPAEYYAALLDVFPERSSYIASARGKGFEFLPPDVNRSTYGFGIDKMIQNGIRVGLTKIKGLGPVAVDEIIVNNRSLITMISRARQPGGHSMHLSWN